MRKPGLRAHLRGSDFAGRRTQKNVIKREGFRKRMFDHDAKMRAGAGGFVIDSRAGGFRLL